MRSPPPHLHGLALPSPISVCTPGPKRPPEAQRSNLEPPSSSLTKTASPLHSNHISDRKLASSEREAGFARRDPDRCAELKTEKRIVRGSDNRS